jgi:short-subunit dehydrogenase
MAISLRNKVVVITGASAGIGREAALLFAREGAHVVVAARRAERLEEVKRQIEAEGGKCLAVPTDVADRALVQRLLDATLEHFGRVDVWINNAGYGLAGSIEQTTPEEMERMMAVNYMGAFHGCQVALQQMRRQGSGHILNVSSLAARFPLPLHGAYTATKYALNGLTETLALELDGSGIQVSLLMPGVTDTEFTDAMIKKIPDSPGAIPGGSASARSVAARIVRCAKRPKRVLMFMPAPPFVLALFDLFPSLWRVIARRYLRVRTGGKGITS